MKILMIGNSYTFFNEMPELLQTLARENGKDVTVDSVTKGGRRLCENLDVQDEYHQRIKALLEAHAYDVLILQEHSLGALLDYEHFESGVSNLMKLIGAKRSILYATWGRYDGNEKLEQYGWTREGMTFDIDAAYCRTAKKYGAEVAPVGVTFYRILERHPEAELYHPDLSHPSYTGSCVAAIVHYAKIFGELPCKYKTLNLDNEQFTWIAEAVREALGEGS
ncbi:MAG: hypothetical protein IJW92_02770 [Clostridia bacterium]|nr:hypothetical protein [Clostridia bacterium]